MLFDWPEKDEDGNIFLETYKSEDKDLLSVVGTYWNAVQYLEFSPAQSYDRMADLVGEEFAGEIINPNGAREEIIFIPMTDRDDLEEAYLLGLLDPPDEPMRGTSPL